jgi:DNA-binding transcriptional LysR family regulator
MANLETPRGNGTQALRRAPPAKREALPQGTTSRGNLGARLAATDLNLLVAFDALVAEGSVTRAASRVGLTQPAMSHALARLRRLFGDPLLVRTPNGMVPTVRAKELIVPIRNALGQIDGALRSPGAFDPRTARRTFSIACVDFGSMVVVPLLYARLRAEAPQIDLHVRPLRGDQCERQLSEGELDLGIGVFADHEARAVVRQKLFDERFVCIVRAGHPAVGASLSLAEFVALDHALIAPRGTPGGQVDRSLAEHGLRRRVVLVVPHFLAAPMVIARSDLILTVAERIARAFSTMLPLRIVDPPLPLPGFTVSQYWHERQARDPAHAWFRGLVADVCRHV